jgi:hypothetical protein
MRHLFRYDVPSDKDHTLCGLERGGDVQAVHCSHSRADDCRECRTVLWERVRVEREYREGFRMRRRGEPVRLYLTLVRRTGNALPVGYCIRYDHDEPATRLELLEHALRAGPGIRVLWTDREPIGQAQRYVEREAKERPGGSMR